MSQEERRRGWAPWKRPYGVKQNAHPATTMGLPRPDLLTLRSELDSTRMDKDEQVSKLAVKAEVRKLSEDERG